MYKAIPLITRFHSGIRKKLLALNILCPISTPGTAQNTHHLSGTPANTTWQHSEKQDLDLSSIFSHCLMRITLTTRRKSPPPERFAIAAGSSWRLETTWWWKQEGCIFKSLLLYTRTNAGCDVCLVLLIYFAGVCNSEYALSGGTMHA